MGSLPGAGLLQHSTQGNADLKQAEAVVSGTAGQQDGSEFSAAGLARAIRCDLTARASSLPPLSLSLGLHAKRAGVTGSESQGSQPITATPAIDMTSQL
jgi:hypothetical protein